MKKAIIIFLFMFTGMAWVSAQKYAYVNTEYILKNMQSYKDAQQELNRLSQQWQTEIQDRYDQIKRLKDSYQAEKVLLTDDMRTKREKEIADKEKEAEQLQRQRFGVKGDLFKKRQELLQPIQQQIYNAIQELAQQSGYMVIFDKAGQSNILYADPRYDKSDRILLKLGISPGSNDKSNDQDKGNSNSKGAGSSSPSVPAKPGGKLPHR